MTPFCDSGSPEVSRRDLCHWPPQFTGQWVSRSPGGHRWWEISPDNMAKCVISIDKQCYYVKRYNTGLNGLICHCLIRSCLKHDGKTSRIQNHSSKFAIITLLSPCAYYHRADHLPYCSLSLTSISRSVDQDNLISSRKEFSLPSPMATNCYWGVCHDPFLRSYKGIHWAIYIHVTIAHDLHPSYTLCCGNTLFIYSWSVH